MEAVFPTIRVLARGGFGEEDGDALDDGYLTPFMWTKVHHLVSSISDVRHGCTTPRHKDKMCRHEAY